jgi:FMN phosphatase YigB (HAD superfamily)
MQPKFLYFDLGKVLVDFSYDQMLAQIGDVAEIEPEVARAAIFDGDLLHRLESGRLSSAEFYEAFCAATGSRPEFAALAAAASEIFSLNLPVVPIVAQLQQAGYRLGVLSNTCEIHWDYCRSRYRIVGDGFGVHTLSFRVGAAKPEAAMFRAAAELAATRPEDIFYVDDMPQHVAGARAVGFDAVQFTTARALAGELRRRGLRWNY